MADNPDPWGWQKTKEYDKKKKNSSAPSGMTGTSSATGSGSGADQQTTANRVNQQTPFGQQQWTHNPDGTWTQNTSLSPGLQGAYDSTAQQMQNAWAKPMDDGSHARDQAISSAYGQSVSRLNPQWNQREHSMQAQLANQGLDPHSEAFRTANEQMGRDRNDAYSTAMNGAIAQGTAAQQATFAQNLAARNAPLQQMQGLQGLTGMPGYNSAGDYMQQQMLQQQMMADAIKGGGQLATSVSGLAQPSAANQPMSYGSSPYINPAGYDDQGWGNYPSDERLKTDIQRLPVEAAPGVPLALFSYKADPQKQRYAGVIAQDLEQSHPEHVTEEGGVKMVSPAFKPFAFGRKGT